MLFFWRPSGTCPEAFGRVPRHLRMALGCLLKPSGPSETHQSPKWKLSFFSCFDAPTDPPETCKRNLLPCIWKLPGAFGAGKTRIEYQHRLHMKLESWPNGSKFDQRAHICAEVLDTKFSLSAILLFEREVNLLLYGSLWFHVYTLLTFYSIKKQSRTRFLAKLQTYILHDKMQNAVFLASIWNLPRSNWESLQAPQNGSGVSLGPSGTS